jgi:hypothetical protein
MRFRLALALSISVLLIGGASWTRFSRADTYHADLAVVPSAALTADYQNLLAASATLSTSTPKTQEPLTETDLIGRQMILDYISLAANGQATDATVNDLANRYIESLSTLNRASTISQAEIKIVANDKANFQEYANVLAQIHIEYAKQINKSGNTINIDPDNPSLDPEVTGRFQKAYALAASKLTDLSVPLTLVPSHLKLVNSYMSSAEAMKHIAAMDKDVISAFASLIVANENLTKETAALDEIARILTSNGI